MTSRAAVAVLLLSIWCCKASEAGPAGVRPPEAGPLRDGVAHVLLVEGDARVHAAGGQFAARKGFRLDRSDELEVGLGGLLLVELKNGYLVRVDEDLRLPVRDIMLLDAPPPEESLEAQLAKLLTAEERRQFPERIVGFHARVAGAESVGALPQKKAQTRPGIASAGVQGPPPAPTTMRRRPLAIDRFEESVEAGSAVAKSKEVAGADSVVVKEEREVASASWAVLVNGRAQRRGDALPAPIAAAIADKLECLQQAAPELPSRPASLQLLLRVKEGKVVRVALGDGLPVPECARSLEGTALVVQGGAKFSWVAVEVPLK